MLEVREAAAVAHDATAIPSEAAIASKATTVAAAMHPAKVPESAPAAKAAKPTTVATAATPAAKAPESTPAAKAAKVTATTAKVATTAATAMETAETERRFGSAQAQS